MSRDRRRSKRTGEMFGFFVAHASPLTLVPYPLLLDAFDTRARVGLAGGSNAIAPDASVGFLGSRLGATQSVREDLPEAFLRNTWRGSDRVGRVEVRVGLRGRHRLWKTGR